MGARLHRGFIRTAFGLLSLASSLALLPGCGPRPQAVRPIRRDVTQAVYASGKVYPERYYHVSASVPGYLDKVLVAVGDTVRVGQPLFSVKNETGGYTLAASQNTLELARRNAAASGPLLRAAEEEVIAARSRYELDSASYARYAGLQAQGAGTRQALDQARTQAETSAAALQRARANVAATRLRLQTELANADAAFKAQRAGVGTYTVQSTLDGMVYDQAPKPGEYVGPQTVVMELGETGRYEVELSVDEADLALVRPGQRIFFGSDVFGKTLVEGRVREVYPKISPISKSIKALADISLPPGLNVYAGSTLEANIIYAQKAKVLTLPRAYVVRDSISVRRGGKYIRQAVQTGISDNDYVEVTGGADEGTEAYLR